MVKIISVILSFIMLFPSYVISFLPAETDTSFSIETGNEIMLNGEKADVTAVQNDKKFSFDFNNSKSDWFNYYGISYKSDAYMKGVITYKDKLSAYSEEFFLEPSDGEKPFYSFIDGLFKGTKSDTLCSITFEPLNKETADFTLFAVSLFNRAVPDDVIYIETEEYKLGVNLEWGGAIEYLEDKNSNVEAVSVNGITKVDSNASERYGTRAISKNVNLINRSDTGRLVQQSYYGTWDYENGYYGDIKWNYNPVQGGNVYNEASKIVDVINSDNFIYIKCRPLDWAKSAEYITPSYMEAYYKAENGCISVECRFVDYSGYPEEYTTQELPAFYCIEPLNRFVYYSGDAPWTGDKALSYENDLIFWPDAGYPNFNSTENWSAFIGEFDDSFGIGLYVPHNASFLAGVYDREKTEGRDPSVSGTTSYIAAVEYMTFRSFSPIEYNYFITTGTTDEIRENFNNIR